jgi:hypothetical protein
MAFGNCLLVHAWRGVKKLNRFFSSAFCWKIWRQEKADSSGHNKWKSELGKELGLNCSCVVAGIHVGYPAVSRVLQYPWNLRQCVTSTSLPQFTHSCLQGATQNLQPTALGKGRILGVLHKCCPEYIVLLKYFILPLQKVEPDSTCLKCRVSYSKWPE